MNEISANCENEIKERFTTLSLKIQEKIDLIMHSLASIKVPVLMPYYNENEDKNLGLISPSRIIKEEKDYYSFPESIYELVKNTEEYCSITQSINLNDNPSFLTEDHIKQFIFDIGEKLINKSDSNKSIIHDTIETFTNDLYDRPVKAKSIIKLSGVDVSQLKVSLHSECSKIMLRSVEKNDVIETINDKHMNIFGLEDRFSSIVEIEHNDDIFAEVNKMVALLRLYAVASVNYKYFKTKEETVIEKDKCKKKITTHINLIEINPWVKSQQFSVSITNENYGNLVDHYRRLYEHIPLHIYVKPKTSINICHPSLEVAYRHYSDALVRWIEEEEIILNAVIGLESLLIDGTGDNTIRFWLRGTKIISFFKYSPLLIKDILSSAYNTRSKFVHGNSKELHSALKKFDSTNQNKDRLASLKNLLECLRVLLILNIFLITKDEFIKDGKFSNKDFLKIVDNSLIDKEADDKLNSILKECHQAFGINLELIP
jgi:Apea-like HEPN